MHAVKRDMAERQMRTRVAMDALRPAARTAIEGVRAGVYVRMRFTGEGRGGWGVRMWGPLHIPTSPRLSCHLVASALYHLSRLSCCFSGFCTYPPSRGCRAVLVASALTHLPEAVVPFGGLCT